MLTLSRPQKVTPVNYFDPSCALCTASIPGPHSHELTSGPLVWVVPSTGRKNVWHEVWWEDAISDWCCSCEHYQARGYCAPTSNHVMRIQAAVRDGATSIPGYRVVSVEGPELFSDDPQPAPVVETARPYVADCLRCTYCHREHDYTPDTLSVLAKLQNTHHKGCRGTWRKITLEQRNREARQARNSAA